MLSLYYRINKSNIVFSLASRVGKNNLTVFVKIMWHIFYTKLLTLWDTSYTLIYIRCIYIVHTILYKWRFTSGPPLSKTVASQRRASVCVCVCPPTPRDGLILFSPRERFENNPFRLRPYRVAAVRYSQSETCAVKSWTIIILCRHRDPVLPSRLAPAEGRRPPLPLQIGPY